MKSKATKEKIKNILYQFANKEIPQNTKEFDILFDLLQNHPYVGEKIGNGVDYFYVQPSKWKINQYNFMIKRLDGTSVDFSYIKCLHPKRLSSINYNWNSIFREIISPQIEQFKLAAFNTVCVKNKFVCSHTNLKFDKQYAQVDHVYPLTFESILNEFIVINNIDVNKLILTEDTGTSETVKIVDIKLRNNFYNFHKQRAVLRLVCINANLQGKRTKNYNGENPNKLKNELITQYPQYHL